MTLFVRGNFVSRSGLALAWKIEGDALDAEDWATLSEVYAGLAFPPFGKVIGITGGGVPFAMALRKYATAGAPGILVCDDVLTTGESFRIAFDRSGQPLPAGAFALFSLNVTRIAR